ncbi:hypothetical protein CLU96_1265 [Chryseobacterium sp. 52]|uniref:hypothetical protein n=1 Tax=Chryseobacterium sp. 52 TaxID=2035213 RepID=UPI000C18AD78|nr:hypothetical protein [Chryseobacterium sp. 52]PIF44322.1 hypothetical protein CLU96_1265 [Chryseobacterium sp. 52]
MRKLISISVLALVMLASCQNSNDELNHQTTGNTNISADEAGLKAAVIDLVGENTRLAPYIVCHTSWLSTSGTSCVISGDGIYQVTWTDGYTTGNNGQSVQTIIYTATATTSCGC